MRKLLNFSFLLVISLLILSCEMEEEIKPTTDFLIDDSEYTDVIVPKKTWGEYGHYNGNDFRINKYSKTGSPRPLVIAIHGGGFIGGSFEDMIPENFNGGINWVNESKLYANNIAYVTINYKTINPDNPAGVDIEDCLLDIKEMVRYFTAEGASKYNINPNKIILFGCSAGSSAALWISLNNNFRDNIKGLVCFDTQASLDISQWWETILEPNGCSQSFYNNNIAISNIKELMNALYGTDNMVAIRYYSIPRNLHYINKIDSGDPEIFMNTRGYDFLHNMYHVAAIIRKSKEKGHVSKANYVYPNWVNNNYEGMADFCLRKFGL